MHRLSRRQLLLRAGRAGIASAGLGLLAGCGVAGTGRLLPAPASGAPRLETTTLRMVQIPTICQAPQYVVSDLMRAEGITRVEYIQKGGTRDIEAALASGEADINMHFAAPSILRIDAGDPITILAGGHVGCFGLFATGQIQAVRDLRAKRLGVSELGASQASQADRAIDQGIVRRHARLTCPCAGRARCRR